MHGNLPDAWERFRVLRTDEMRRQGLTGEWAGHHGKLEALARAAIDDELGPDMARRVPLSFEFDHAARRVRCVPGEGSPPVVATILDRIGRAS